VNHQQAVEKRRGAPVNGISKTQLASACLREAPPCGAKAGAFLTRLKRKDFQQTVKIIAIPFNKIKNDK